MHEPECLLLGFDSQHPWSPKHQWGQPLSITSRIPWALSDTQTQYKTKNKQRCQKLIKVFRDVLKCWSTGSVLVHQYHSILSTTEVTPKHRELGKKSLKTAGCVPKTKVIKLYIYNSFHPPFLLYLYLSLPSRAQGVREALGSKTRT